MRNPFRCTRARPHSKGTTCDLPSLSVTEPSKWPGVTSLRALLDREKDDETPNLNVLLCETFVAIYLSLLSYALATCDAQILYRLVSQKVTANYWSHVFGGGAKKMLNYEKTQHPALAKELSVRFVFHILEWAHVRVFSPGTRVYIYCILYIFHRHCNTIHFSFAH